MGGIALQESLVRGDRLVGLAVTQEVVRLVVEFHVSFFLSISYGAPTSSQRRRTFSAEGSPTGTI